MQENKVSKNDEVIRHVCEKCKNVRHFVYFVYANGEENVKKWEKSQSDIVDHTQIKNMLNFMNRRWHRLNYVIIECIIIVNEEKKEAENDKGKQQNG